MQKIIEKREENLSLEKIANLCGISKVQVFDLVKGNKGNNLTLNMAFRVYEGLGGELIELIAGLEPEFPWASIVRMKPEDREVIIEVINRLDTEEDTLEKAIIRTIVKGLPPRLICQRSKVNFE